MNILIQSISSDIGFELAKFWHNEGHRVLGTFRAEGKNTKELTKLGVPIYKLDLEDSKEIAKFHKRLPLGYSWNYLIMAAGSQEPVGTFENIEFSKWKSSIGVNFIGQFHFLHSMLAFRSKKSIPSVLFFAGGGTNNATLNYSAYTIGKIASIKMIELLDAEIKDVKFSILGPGWVKTKLHRSTLGAGAKSAGDNYEKTKMMLDGDACYPIEKVVECVNWLLKQPRSLIGGRNFSAVHDPWGDDKLKKLNDDPNFFKLRRFGNNVFGDADG